MPYTRCVVLLLCMILAGGLLFAADPIVTEGVVNAPVEAVWSAFTTREGIEAWMVAKTDIDLRAGGLWRTSYNRESTLDDDTAIHQIILSYDPGRMLSFRVAKPPANFPFPAAIREAWTVVYFEPAGPAQTRVTIRMLGFTDSEQSGRMRDFFESGNLQTLDNLVKRFGGNTR